MMIRAVRTRLATGRPARAAIWGVGGVLLTVTSMYAPLNAQSAPAAQSQQQTQKRVFGSDAGLVLNFIKADKTADFETVLARLKEALQKSDKPERKQQAASWKVFKGVEPG